MLDIDKELYKELIDTFKPELEEHITNITDILIALEKEKNHSDIVELLQDAFRVAHNIKGAASSVSIESIVVVAHELEDFFTELKSTQDALSNSQIDFCLSKVDQIKESFETFYREFLGEQSFDVEAQEAVFEDKKDLPENIHSEDNKSIKIKSSSIQVANNRADEVFMCHMHIQNLAFRLEEHKREISLLQKDLSDTGQSYNRGISNVCNYIYQGACNLEGEVKNLHEHFLNQVGALQSTLRDMRLIPISTTLNSLRRVVRDISRDLEKEVEIEIIDRNIEIDKLILDALKDPLVHIVRNAIDHGIENSTVRDKLGKSRVGKIKVEVNSDSGKIILQISDDGAGINVNKIKQKAIEAKLFSQENASNLSDNEALDLIFMHGFSTKDTVSNVSGRGIGMDVVRGKVEDLKGSITIDSEVGKGSTINIVLPLTLATERGVFVEAANQVYIIPSLLLSNIILIDARKITSIDCGEVYMVNNKPMATYTLANILGVQQKTSINDEVYGVILKKQEKEILIVVDKVLSEHDCVVKPLGHYFDNFRLVSGGVLTSRGELVLMLSPSEIFNQAISSETKILKPKNIKHLRVLVADSSISSRTLEVNILNSNGYLADSAVDGEDAWNKIRDNSYDIIIAGMDLPIMNGCELTKKIKGDSRLCKIPVIIMSEDDDVNLEKKSIDAGVDMYVLKKEFDGVKLLETISAMV